MIQEKVCKENFFRKIPIESILEIESLALGFSQEKRKEVLALYSETSRKLIEGCKDFNNSEKGLYKRLFGFFYYTQEFGATNEALLMSLSLISRRFSCYSASLLFADVITKLGRPVDLAFTDSHIFIIGEELAFQTTTGVVNGRNDEVNKFPSLRCANGDKGRLLSLVYEQCAGYLSLSLEQVPRIDPSLESKIDAFLKISDSYRGMPCEHSCSDLLKNEKR